MKKVLIIGGASAIAQETAKCFAQEGAELMLVDKAYGRLTSVKMDIETRYGVNVKIAEFDATNFSSHQTLLEQAIKELGEIDIVLIAYGTLPNQIEIQNNCEEIIKEFNINCVSVILLATIFAQYFAERKKGSLGVITSVAGDRGRKSNYIYGSAKGAVSLFLQGLRNRFAQDNVHILTIKPGLVDTPMTAHLQKNFLFASPKAVGTGIYEAFNNKKEVVYLPKFWRIIMCFVKLIPEKIFKKLNF